MAASTSPPTTTQAPGSRQTPPADLSYEQRRQAAASAVAMVRATLGRDR